MQCLTVSESNAWRSAHSRRRQWKRQITAQTPLDRLAWFSATLVERLTPFDQALLIVDRFVFESDPEALRDVRNAAGERRAVHDAPGHLFRADPRGLTAALEAALSEWVDFRVLFSPPDHALLADHDKYTTIFSKSPGKIAEIRSFLEGQVPLPDYSAPAP
jgi:hypothetical protein